MKVSYSLNWLNVSMTDFESDKNTVLRDTKTSKVTSYEIKNDKGTNQVNKTKVGKF